MRYVLSMSGLRKNLEAYPSRLTPGELAAHLAYIYGITRELEAAGELVSFAELAGPDRARLVRGATATEADRAFPETKEFVAALWIVECEGDERARAIAQRLSLAPGPGGLPSNISIEVRPVLPWPGA